MIFYLGAYPEWLWGSKQVPAAGVPLFVSRRTLKPLKRRGKFPKAKSIWALDSGGFKELEQHGHWTVTPQQYVREVRRLAEEVGKLQWAAVQDWMCEPPILYGGPTDPGQSAPGTGLSVEEHQLRTIENYCRLRELGGREMAHLWAPVLQGWCLEDYVEHVHLWTTVGRVDLNEVPVIGVGSVCRRQGTEMASALFRILTEQFPLKGRLHAFGVKTQGLERQGHVEASEALELGRWADQAHRAGWPLQAIERAMLYASGHAGPSTWEEGTDQVCGLLQSADSFAWSFNARKHANAVRRARRKAFGRDWRQEGDTIYAGGKPVGKVRHELAGSVDPLAPTQKLAACSRSYARGTPGRSHEGCASCRWWAVAWRNSLLKRLPKNCRSTKPPKRRKITHASLCAGAERVASKLAQIRSYQFEVARSGQVDPDRWERLKALPGSEGPLLPVQGLRSVYPRMDRPHPRPAPSSTECRSWGTGDFRWGEARPEGPDLPPIPSPWQPEVMEAVREARLAPPPVGRRMFPELRGTSLFPHLEEPI